MIPKNQDACPFYYNGKNLPDWHRFDIPCEWQYDYHENGTGIAYKRVSKFRCVCGEEAEV